MEEVELNSEVEKRFAPSSLGQGDVQIEVDPELQAELSRIPDKLAFKIGEVADVPGVCPGSVRPAPQARRRPGRGHGTPGTDWTAQSGERFP